MTVSRRYKYEIACFTYHNSMGGSKIEIKPKSDDRARKATLKKRSGVICKKTLGIVRSDKI